LREERLYQWVRTYSSSWTKGYLGLNNRVKRELFLKKAPPEKELTSLPLRTFRNREVGDGPPKQTTGRFKGNDLGKTFLKQYFYRC